jgi:hypothetical protein
VNQAEAEGDTDTEEKEDPALTVQINGNKFVAKD